jgi:phage baseplate assembly protein W
VSAADPPLHGPAFPFRITGGRVAASTGPRKVADDLSHLIGTRVGERVLQRAYGSGIQHGLHEPDDPTLRSLLRHELEQAIRTYLPEIRLIGPVRIEDSPEGVRIALDYAVEPAGPVTRTEAILPRPGGRTP